MREISHSDLHPLLYADSILRIEDLEGLQGSCISFKGDALTFVVTEVSKLNQKVKIDIMEQGRQHESTLSHALFDEAVWYATPRLSALFDAALADRQTKLKEAADRQRAASEAGAAERAREERARREADWERGRQKLLDLPAAYAQDKGAVTPEILGLMSEFRPYILIRDEREAGFFRDMMYSFATYGARTFIREAQADWIKDILRRSAEGIRTAKSDASGAP